MARIWPWRRRRQPEQSTPAPSWPTEQADRQTWDTSRYVIKECEG